jgi:hypothetical protein
VQFLGESSAALLLQRVVMEVAFAVLTLRTDEPVPEAVTTLWEDELVERVEIGPLDRDAVEALLRTGLGGDARVAGTQQP